MKILIIHCSYQDRGGEDTVVDEEVRLLQSKGVKVELLKFDNDRATWAKILQMPFNIGAYMRTKRRITSWKPDLVHVHNLHFGASPSVLYAIKKCGLPFVMTLHNYRLLCPSATLFHRNKLFLNSTRSFFPWEAVREGVYKNSKLLTFWLALTIMLHHWSGIWKKCERYIVLTPHARTIFQESKMGVPKEQLVVKPNFLAAPPSALERTKSGFLYVGRLSDEKGVRLLLDVFSASSFQLKIAGDGPLKNEVIIAAEKHTNIQFLGSREKSEVLSEMSACEALVFPSLWYEGMPLTIIEAFACGVPVIASRLGAMETMITPGYNGLHFEPGHKKDFLGQLMKWRHLTSEEKTQYAANARASYEKEYTAEANAAQLLAIYENVVQNRAHKQLPVETAIA